MKKRLLSILVICLILATTLCTVFAADSEKITSIDQLNGKTIGVQTAVLYEEMLMDRLEGEEWLYFTMPNDMILALDGHKVSAYLLEEVSFKAQAANHPELAVLDEYAGVSKYAVVVGNNERQEKQLAEMNEFIAKSHEDGWLDELYDYWVMNFDADTCEIDYSKYQSTGENGSVKIAIEGGYEPFSYTRDGELCGFDVEFMLGFCKEYGYTADFDQVSFESIAPGAESGKYDYGLNIVISDERSEGAVLSDPYYTCNIVVVVEQETEQTVGFFQNLVDSFYKTFIKESRWKLFVEGTGLTTLITVVSILLGTLLGFLMYMWCRHGRKVPNKIVGAFTWLIDGMPTVVLLMILYYIVFGSTELSGTIISIIGFSLIFSCGMYDMLKVGCNAVGKGQVEASRALGYSDSQSFFKIILPQAARHFLPIYKNDVVSLIKETSVVGYIAVLDLTKISDLVRSRTYEAFFALIASAIIYFVISGILTAIVGAIEKKLDPHRRNEENILKGIKQAE